MLCSHDERIFFHEIAHAAHARVLRSRGEDLRGGQVPSQEIVAEVVAAILCRLFDLDPGQLAYSAQYIASYAKGGNPGRAAMRVLSDVQAVLSPILDTAEVGAPEAPAPAVPVAAMNAPRIPPNLAAALAAVCLCAESIQRPKRIRRGALSLSVCETCGKAVSKQRAEPVK